MLRYVLFMKMQKVKRKQNNITNKYKTIYNYSFSFFHCKSVVLHLLNYEKELEYCYFSPPFLGGVGNFSKLKTMVNLNRIKVVLVEQGKSGKWLAEQLNKSTCTVSKWCTNTAQPDLQTLDQIAKILKVDIKTLLYDTNFNENI